MCIVAPESTTNSLPFGFVKDGAGGHQPRASLRPRRSCFKVSSSELSSNFGAKETTLMTTSVLNHNLRRTLSFSNFVTWRDVPFGNCTVRFGAKFLCPSVKNELDFGGSMSRNTQPDCLEVFSPTRQQNFQQHSCSVFC